MTIAASAFTARPPRRGSPSACWRRAASGPPGSSGSRSGPSAPGRCRAATSSVVAPMPGTMIAARATFWLRAFALPKRPAEMITFSEAATSRSPVTANSRAMMTIGDPRGHLIGVHQAHERGGDQELVGQGVEEGAGHRHLAARAGQPSVDRVGEAGEREDREGPPARARDLGDQQEDHQRWYRDDPDRGHPERPVHQTRSHPGSIDPVGRPPAVRAQPASRGWLGVGGIVQPLARLHRVPARRRVAPASSRPAAARSVRHRSGTPSPPATLRAFGQRGWNGQPGGGFGRRGDVAAEHDPVARRALVALGHGRQEGRRVGVARVVVERRPSSPARRCGPGTSPRSGRTRGAPRRGRAR